MLIFLVARLLGPTGKIQRKNLASHFAKATTSNPIVPSSASTAVDRLLLVKRCLAQILSIDTSEIKDESTLFQLGQHSDCTLIGCSLIPDIFRHRIGADSLSFIRFSTALKKEGYSIKLNSLFRDPSISSIPQLLEPIANSSTSGGSPLGSSKLVVPDPEPFSLLGANTEAECSTLKEYIISQLTELNVKSEDVEEATPFVPGQEQMRWKIQSCPTLPLWWLSDSYRLKPEVDRTRWIDAWNQTFEAEPVSKGPSGTQ